MIWNGRFVCHADVAALHETPENNSNQVSPFPPYFNVVANFVVQLAKLFPRKSPPTVQAKTSYQH